MKNCIGVFKAFLLLTKQLLQLLLTMPRCTPQK